VITTRTSRARSRLARLAVIAVAAGVGLLAPASPAQAAMPSTVVVSHTTYKQNTYYNCGPTATQIALTTWGINVSASTLGQLEGTTTNGTDDISHVTYALNYEVNKYKGYQNWYRSVYITGSTATSTDVATLKQNLITDVYNWNKGFVANVYGSAVDTNGKTHSYSGGHYLAIVGFAYSGDWVRVADNADGTEYWMTTARMATWIAEKGYSV
jgi:hypothetical protein